MPEERTQFYQLTGWETVTIYTEQEMADALDLTRDELRQALGQGQLSYHAHPLSNKKGEYQFRPEGYQENIEKWACLQNGGHHWQEIDRYSGLIVYQCRDCPAKTYGDDVA